MFYFGKEASRGKHHVYSVCQPSLLRACKASCTAVVIEDKMSDTSL